MKKNILMLGLIASLYGCASIISGTSQEVTFNSEPAGATIIIGGKVVGQTPTTIHLDKIKNQQVLVKKAGYRTMQGSLKTSVDPWFFGNVIIGGFFGSTTDGATGAMHQYSPDHYMILLERKNFVSRSSSTSRKLKDFIFTYSDEVRIDISKGYGEKLDALIELIGISDNKKEITENLRLMLDQDDFNLANSLTYVYKIKD